MKLLPGCAGLLAGIVLLSGCSTFFSRIDGGQQARLYPATHFAMDAAGDGWCWMFLACPALMLSLPVDAALDTLLLPADALRVRQRDEARAREAAGVTEPS